MRFSVLVAGAFAAIASAQTSTPAATEVATQTYSIDPVQSSVHSCLDKCEIGDVECQSHCITVPAPNDQQANDTITCVAGCDQGDGSEEQTQKYSDCTQACIKKHYYDVSEGTPKGTGSANSGSDSAKSSAEALVSGASKTASAIASDASSMVSAASSAASSAAAAATTSAKSAAPAVAVGSAALLGLFAAVLAL